jgi:putative tryptophan/tyrosine transport system substrate-binding protein
MRRREFVTLLGGAAAAGPVAAGAQQRPAMPVIGWLSARSAAIDALILPTFHRALNAQGFIEGRNFTVEYRYANGYDDRLPGLAADLVRRRPNVVVTMGNAIGGARAMQAANRAIPILFITSADPVKEGLITSFNRPGGNATGVTVYQGQIAPKRLGLLHDLLPRANTIAVFLHPADALEQAADAREGASKLGLQVKVLSAGTEGDLDAVFANLATMPVDALFVTQHPFFFTRMNQIITATTRLALPSSFFRREFVVAGGLMSYASNSTDSYRILGEYAGRILKGEKPADLPVQQPTKLELVLNLISAKALGHTVPTSMLLLADEVIE